MKIIGITGGVGAGKSTVLNYLKGTYGACVLQADQVGHLLMRPGESCYGPMVELFGREILREDGTIDRKKVGGIVFSNDRLLKKLNNIIHPQVKKYIFQEISRQKEAGTELFVLEAALLLEDEYDAICDEVWYIYADEETRKRRLMASRGYSEEKIQGIFDSQMSSSDFFTYCDRAVDNCNSFQEACGEIDDVMAQLGIEKIHK